MGGMKRFAIIGTGAVGGYYGALLQKAGVDRGNPMEVESIYGNPLRAARAGGVPMPETETLYRKLIALNP
jgi:ketopantoate reductase